MSDGVIPIRERVSKRQQLPEEVATYVREMIISGAVRPGEFLRMEPIADAVGVSITPVREGLLALRSEGFVQLVPRRGFVVAPFTQQDVRDLFWAQAQLGGELAARAAKRLTPELLALLETWQAQYEKAFADDDEEAMAHFGHAFHREINLAADSPRLALLLGSIVKHLPNRFYALIEGKVPATLKEHAELVEALRARNARKARSVMEQHLFGTADRLIAHLEKRQIWTAPAEAVTSSS